MSEQRTPADQDHDTRDTAEHADAAAPEDALPEARGTDPDLGSEDTEVDDLSELP